MAASGVGRGRGWLNLNKTNVNRPGKSPSPQTNINEPQYPQSPNSIKCTSPCPQQYENTISLISKLSNTDDGILMNQKYRIILETWKKDCPTSNEVEESFNYIYQMCLEDEVFAMKVVSMVSSYSFSTAEVSDQKIRRLFITQVQTTYEGCKQLQQTSPRSFRIAVQILSEYYNKARYCDGRPISFLATPLLCYFDMLLDSAQPADLELFTTQLQLNGSGIKTNYPQQLADLINRVRKILVTTADLCHRSKLYLLLAIDIANNRFSLLSADIIKFYQEELGDEVISQFQGMLGALSIQTQQTNKTLDSYQSSVNVLQVTPPESTSPVNDHQQTTVQNKFNNTQNYNSQCYSTNDMNVGTWDAQQEKVNNSIGREKTGRPILGAGARLQKDKNDGTSHWKDSNKDSTVNWSDKTQTSWRDKKQTKSYSKGWEHDDRFENEYN